MTDHGQLFDEAVDAATRLFSDESVSHEQTKEDLECLMGEIQILIDTLDRYVRQILPALPVFERNEIMERKIVLWGKADDERLTHTEMDDAIESMLDGMDDDIDLPETIEVCGFAHTEPNIKKEAAGILERFIEGLDENYGDPDGSYTETTDRMKESAEEFVTAVLEEYQVWACDIVKRETVNVQEWIKDNRPDWL